jgi:hypothetical protein
MFSAKEPFIKLNFNQKNNRRFLFSYACNKALKVKRACLTWQIKRLEKCHSGLTRGHNKNDKIQKNYYFLQIQSILTLWQKIDLDIK